MFLEHRLQAAAHAVVLAVQLATLEVDRQTGVVVPVHIGVDGRSHAGVLVGVPHLLEGIEDHDRPRGFEPCSVVGGLHHARRHGRFGILLRLAGLDEADAHRHTEFDRVGQFEPFRIVALVDGVHLFERMRVGRVGGVFGQGGDRRVQIAEEILIDGLLRLVGVFGLPEMRHGDRAVDVRGALERHHADHFGHGEDVVGDLSVLMGVFELQPCGHHVGEGHRKGDVVVVRAVEVVGAGVAASVEGLDRGEIAAEGVAHQVAGALVFVRALVAGGNHGVALHRGDVVLHVDLLHRVGVGVEGVEVSRAGGRHARRCGEKSQFDMVDSCHEVLGFRIGVLR